MTQVPLFLTAATDATLSRWEGHWYPFNPSEYRPMASLVLAGKQSEGTPIPVGTRQHRNESPRRSGFPGRRVYLGEGFLLT